MPEGGDLIIKTKNVTHEDMTGKLYKPKPGNYVLLSVKDTGTGMDEETMEHIFEPFFTTKGLACGTGLGLASTYGIVKGHGGYIDVDSATGEGTTFHIYLPGSEETFQEEQELPGKPVKGNGTVLLVDDEEIILSTGEQMLGTLGYKVLPAAGGREAVRLFEENLDKIDLVLLDMVMPSPGGGKTFDKLKEINPDVKVLLSSGYSINGEAKEIMNRGCDGFIQKPFDMGKLSQSIQEILEKRSG
jgi:two-component system cell cycle sensor histidine kinase/response regulator CckA